MTKRHKNNNKNNYRQDAAGVGAVWCCLQVSPEFELRHWSRVAVHCWNTTASSYNTCCYWRTSSTDRHGRLYYRPKQVFWAPFSQMLTDLDEVCQGSVVDRKYLWVQFYADRCMGDSRL